MKYRKLRKQTLKANQMLALICPFGLTWGNTSICDRQNSVIAIKPSGIPFSKIKLRDIVIVDLNGRIVDGKKAPSVDMPTHLVIYKNFDHINCIVHAHSKWATVWAQAGMPIPILGTTHADFANSEIPCTPPIREGDKLDNYEFVTGEMIIKTLRGYNITATPAILCNQHGSFAWGKDYQEAMDNAVTLEMVAELAYHTYKLCPKQVTLSKNLTDKHFFRKHGRKAYYGQGDKNR